VINFLKAVNSLERFWLKGKKFFIIAFLLFWVNISIKRGRVSFFKVNTGVNTNWIYDRRVYLPWYKSAVTKLFACGNASLAFKIFICWSFFYLNSFLVAFASNIVCVKSFRLIKHGKQIIGKPVCIERDERHGTWQDTAIGLFCS